MHGAKIKIIDQTAESTQHNVSLKYDQLKSICWLRTGGMTDTTKLKVTIRKFAMAPKVGHDLFLPHLSKTASHSRPRILPFETVHLLPKKLRKHR
jgi:hypothetical protein